MANRYLLLLSDMRAAQIERSDRPVAWARTKEALESLLEREKVEPYKEPDGDRVWTKTFRKGGPLEWFNNERGAFGEEKVIDIPDPDEAAEAARVGAERFFQEVPEAGA